METAIWVLVAVQVLFGVLLLWDNFAGEKTRRIHFEAIYTKIYDLSQINEVHKELAELNERLRLRGYRTEREERQLEIDNLN